MSARTATVNIFVDGKAMDKEQRSTVTSVTYTDPASGQADSLDIAVSGGGNKWITDWYPGEGKVVSATIVLSDWEQEGAQDITLDCGKFILDEPKFSGWPVSGTLSAVSTPANKGFSKTERTKTWENVTLKEIGKILQTGQALRWPGMFPAVVFPFPAWSNPKKLIANFSPNCVTTTDCRSRFTPTSSWSTTAKHTRRRPLLIP